MPWLVDEVAEAALGPWGLLVGVGVGVGVLARKRLAPAASAALGTALGATEKARENVGTRDVAREVGARVRGSAAAVASLPVVERAQTALAEAGDWWSDVCAEARAEWEEKRSAPTQGVEAATRRRARASSRSARARDASGRFIKGSTPGAAKD